MTSNRVVWSVDDWTAEETALAAESGRWLRRLAQELHRLSSHRDDGMAIAALGFWNDLRALGDAFTAQEFGDFYIAIYRAERRSIGTDTRQEWRALHRTAMATFHSILRQWQAQARLRAAAERQGSPGRSSIPGIPR